MRGAPCELEKLGRLRENDSKARLKCSRETTRIVVLMELLPYHTSPPTCPPCDYYTLKHAPCAGCCEVIVSPCGRNLLVMYIW